MIQNKKTPAGSLQRLSSLKRQMDNHVASNAGAGSAQTSADAAQRFRAIPISDIYSIEQPRTVFEGIEDLAKSMKEIGQLQPIVVNPDGKGKFIIEQGERRWRAAKLAGLATLDAVVKPEENHQNNPERIVRQLVENVQRDDMKLFELVRCIHTVIGLGMKGRELARRLGMSESDVSNYNSVAELPPCLDAIFVGMNILDVKALRRLKSLYQTYPQQVEDQIDAWRKDFEDMQMASALLDEGSHQNPEDSLKSPRFIITRAQVQQLDVRLTGKTPKKAKPKATQTPEPKPHETPVEDEQPVSTSPAEVEETPQVKTSSEQTPHQPSKIITSDMDISVVGGQVVVQPDDNGSENLNSDYQQEAESPDLYDPEEKQPVTQIKVHVFNQGAGFIPLDRVPPPGKAFVTLLATHETVLVSVNAIKVVSIGGGHAG